MVDFNPDGSIKMPEGIARKKEEKERRLKKSRCILFRKEAKNFNSTKKCVLHMKLSESFGDSDFVESVYRGFRNSSEVPSKIARLNDKEFDVEIGSSFRRCSDCNSL